MILNQLKYKKNIFYEKIDSKLSKMLSMFSYIIKELNTRNIIYIFIYCSLFAETAKFYFATDKIKYLPAVCKNLLLQNIEHFNIQSIKKVGILMGGDNWKRVPLQEDHEYVLLFKKFFIFFKVFSPKVNCKKKLLSLL